MYSHHFLSLLSLGYVVGTTAHGGVVSVKAEGVTLDGFQKTYFNHKETPAWKIPKQIEGAYGVGPYGPLNASFYKTPHINCHLDATSGDISLKVQAGNDVQIQWSVWPTSHHGPIIDYLANCHGPCHEVDPSTLMFNKIDEMGLIDTKLHKYPDETKPTTRFAADKLIEDNNLWTVNIPSYVAPGQYVLRHETIALHNSWIPGGAQHIPQCINLEVTGLGTDPMTSGTLGTELYSTSQPGLGVINIYFKPPMEYIIPGPPLYRPQAQNSSQTSHESTTTSSVSVFNTVTRSVNPQSSASSKQKSTSSWLWWEIPHTTTPSLIAFQGGNNGTTVATHPSNISNAASGPEPTITNQPVDNNLASQHESLVKSASASVEPTGVPNPTDYARPIASILALCKEIELLSG